ncbi:MAG: hypothetical protein Q8O00_11790 [Holophaga sp.]|nr:hypothetical protein [Holophaga sp.]
MYKKTLKVFGEYLAQSQSLPLNASADGNGVELPVDKTMGALEVVVEVDAQVGLADTKVLSVKLQHKDVGGAYADLATIYAKTAAGATTLAAGSVLARYTLPSDCKALIKAVITTTDAAATGKLNVFPSYLAR